MVKIAIADDQVLFRDMLSIILKQEPAFEVVGCAGNGKEIVQLCGEKHPDVVLLDVKMPGRDGIDTLREIKHLAPMVEVLILTGHASVETGIDSIKYGAFDYLMKPIDIEPLMEKLDAAYERKRIQQEKLEAVQNKRDMVPPKKG